LATEIAPTKVNAMNRSNSISDTWSTGSSTGSRAGSDKRPGSLMSGPWASRVPAGRPQHNQNFSGT
jgi:hypothetical protein